MKGNCRKFLHVLHIILGVQKVSVRLAHVYFKQVKNFCNAGLTSFVLPAALILDNL